MSVYDIATIFSIGFLLGAFAAIAWVMLHVARAQPRRRRSAT